MIANVPITTTIPEYSHIWKQSRIVRIPQQEGMLEGRVCGGNELWNDRTHIGDVSNHGLYPYSS